MTASSATTFDGKDNINAQHLSNVTDAQASNV